MIIDAWLIKKQLSGETSLELTLFTREKAVIRARYRGARTAKKQSLLQPFNLLYLLLDHRHEKYIQQLDCINSPIRLEKNALFSGLYINELISLQQYHELNIELYDCYIDILVKLSSTNNINIIAYLLREFEITWLKCAGYELCLTHEGENNNIIDPKLYYQFIPGSGLKKSQAGFLGEDLILCLELSNLINNKKLMRILKYITRNAIDHALNGREIKSRTLFMHYTQIK